MEKLSNQSPAYKLSREGKIESNAVRLNISDYTVPYYSEQEAQALEEMIVNTETFRKALQILITWLGRGECGERNSAHFCYLIQLGLDHFKKLQTVRKKHLEEAINGIEELFNVIEKPDIWSNFTQSQKENMLNIKINISDLKEKIPTNESVNYQIEENQKTILQIEVGSLTHKLNIANQVIEDQKKEYKHKEDENLQLKEKSRKLQEENKEKLVISLLSAFLCNHQKGVNIDAICSKINSSPIIPNIIRAEEIEDIMRRQPEIFKQVLEEGTQLKKWTTYISFPQATLEELQKSISEV